VRLQKPKVVEELAVNEVRVTVSNHIRTFVKHVLKLFAEDGHQTVVLKATGRAINKTVAIVEVLKRRVAGLHQITELASVEMTDLWEPTQEGLEPLEVVRHVSVVSVTLSKNQLDVDAPGYQPPLHNDQVSPAPDDASAEALANNLEARPAQRGTGEQQDGDASRCVHNITWAGERRGDEQGPPRAVWWRCQSCVHNRVWRVAWASHHECGGWSVGGRRPPWQRPPTAAGRR